MPGLVKTLTLHVFDSHEKCDSCVMISQLKCSFTGVQPYEFAQMFAWECPVMNTVVFIVLCSAICILFYFSS